MSQKWLVLSKLLWYSRLKISRNPKYFTIQIQVLIKLITLGSLSCWKTNRRPMPRSIADCLKPFFRISQYCTLSIRPLTSVIWPTPLDDMKPWMLIFSECLTVGIVKRGLNSSFIGRRTYWASFCPHKKTGHSSLQRILPKESEIQTTSNNQESKHDDKNAQPEKTYLSKNDWGFL